MTAPAFPQLREDLEIRGWQESVHRFVVVDPASGRMFMFRPAEFTILQLLDGRAGAVAVAERATAALQPGRPISPDAVRAFTQHLALCGLLAGSSPARSPRSGTEPEGRDVDLTTAAHLLKPAGALLFSRFPGWAVALTVLAALPAELLAWGRDLPAELTRSLAWPTVLLTLAFVYLSLPLVMAVHELGHAVSLLRFTGQAGTLRVQLARLSARVIASPALVWGVAQRGRRVTLALSGCYFQIIALDAIGLAWPALPGSLFRQFLIGAIIPNLGGLLLNLTPQRPMLPAWRSDGYLAVSYALGIPNLQQATRIYWKQRRPGRAPHQPGLILYAYCAPVLAWLPLTVYGLAAALAVIQVWPGGVVVAAVPGLWAGSPYWARSGI